MNDGSIYDAEYFLHGKESGKSLYQDYRWLDELTTPMCLAIVRHCGIRLGLDTVLDFGCARGYTVKALRRLGHPAYGFDVSEWAIKNADEEIKDCLTLDPEVAFAKDTGYAWVIAKDVLEHVHAAADEVSRLMNAARRGVFAVVPLSPVDGEPYVIAEYEKDVTHIHRMTLASWVRLFVRPGWSIDARYRVEGVKENYSQYETGNGFITARRIG